jgi:hypothetical protein
MSEGSVRGLVMGPQCKHIVSQAQLYKGTNGETAVARLSMFWDRVREKKKSRATLVSSMKKKNYHANYSRVDLRQLSRQCQQESSDKGEAPRTLPG